MNFEFDVLVIGGGIVGLTAALAMAQRGQTVAVIDAGSLTVETSHPDPRVYAINQASQILLQQLGVWEYVNLQRVSPYQKMHVWDGVNGAAIEFDSRDVGTSHLGAIIEESVLKDALLQRIAHQSLISLFPNCCVEEIESGTRDVRVFSSEQTWTGHLLMVADGPHSQARKKLKVELTSWSYGQHALVATVAVEKGHEHTAYQVFNPEGPLAFLPLSDPLQCSIVWSTDTVQAKKLIALSDEEFNDTLTKAFNKKLGEVKVISTRHQFPLHMRHVKQYSGNRWLLLGDAAHTIHPLAGLGLNTGFADVAAWLEILSNHKPSHDYSKALRSYQRERKHAVWQVIALMEGLKRLFNTSFTPLVTLRGLGLGLFNGLKPLKRLLIQQAQGVVDKS